MALQGQAFSDHLAHLEKQIDRYQGLLSGSKRLYFAEDIETDYKLHSSSAFMRSSRTSLESFFSERINVYCFFAKKKASVNSNQCNLN